METPMEASRQPMEILMETPMEASRLPMESLMETPMEASHLTMEALMETPMEASRQMDTMLLHITLMARLMDTTPPIQPNKDISLLETIKTLALTHVLIITIYKVYKILN